MPKLLNQPLLSPRSPFFLLTSIPLSTVIPAVWTASHDFLHLCLLQGKKRGASPVLSADHPGGPRPPERGPGGHRPPERGPPAAGRHQNLLNLLIEGTETDQTLLFLWEL